MSKKTYRRYSAEFKDQVLGLVVLGKPVAEVAQEFQVSTNLIYEWRLRLQGGSAGQLEGAKAREHPPPGRERHFKKAAVILGTKPHLNGAK
jgi:transposase-like protein